MVCGAVHRVLRAVDDRHRRERHDEAVDPGDHHEQAVDQAGEPPSRIATIAAEPGRHAESAISTPARHAAKPAIAPTERFIWPTASTDHLGEADDDRDREEPEERRQETGPKNRPLDWRRRGR